MSAINVLPLTTAIVGRVPSTGASLVALCQRISTPTMVSIEVRPIGTVIIIGSIVLVSGVSHNITVTTAMLILSPDIRTNPDTTRPFLGLEDSDFC